MNKSGNLTDIRRTSGNIPFDMIWDVVSLVTNIVEFVKNPSLENVGYVALDTVSAIVPYLPASSAAIKGGKAVSQGVGVVTDTTSAGKKAAKVKKISKTKKVKTATKAKTATKKAKRLVKGKKVKSGTKTTPGFEDWLNKDTSDNKV